MNEHSENYDLTPEQQQAIDLLIDGELDDESRGALLSSLDYTTHGWRKLAIGFLEVQMMRQEFSPLVASPAPAAIALNERRPPERAASGWGTMLLAMAASFMLAFGLAMWIRSGTHGGENGEYGAGAPLAASPDTADRKSGQANDLLVRPFSEPKTASPLVEVAPPGESKGLTVVPVVAGKTASGRFNPNGVSALPRHVQQTLEQMGHQVETRRKLVPIQLPNGRRVLLPVEEIDVQFVGGRPFQ